MEEYKSNSHKSKEQRVEETAQKRMEKVVTGKAKTKKKNEIHKFTDIFFAEDLSSVGKYLLEDVIIPSSKNLVEDILINGIKRVFHGGNATDASRDYYGGYRGPRISYGGFYGKPDKNRGSEDSRSRSRFDYEDILFESRADAEMVLTQMDEMLERYPTVSVLDMYDAAGITAPYTADKYGWTDIHTAKVVATRDGYVIKLPKAFPLD